MHRAVMLVIFLGGKWEKRLWGGHALGVDRQGEALIWCRKCSGHAAGHALRLSEMLLHGREYRKFFLPTVGARCQHTLPDSTDAQREMRVPGRFAGEAQALAADGGTPEYYGDACDALQRLEMLGGPLHLSRLRRVFVVGHGERLRFGHEGKSNGAASSQQWQSSSASVRGHETEIHAHPRDAAETGHGGSPLANERRLADGQDVVCEVGAAAHAATLGRYVVTSRLRGQGRLHLHRRSCPLGYPCEGHYSLHS